MEKMQTGDKVDSVKCSTYFTFDCWKNSISGDLQNIYINQEIKVRSISVIFVYKCLLLIWTTLTKNYFSSIIAWAHIIHQYKQKLLVT